MPATALGEKQACTACGTKFYDLNRRPAVCPKCKTSFDPDADAVKVARMKAKAAIKAYSAEDEEEVDEEDERERAGDASEDAEDLEEEDPVTAPLTDEEPTVTDDETEEDEPGPGKPATAFGDDEGVDDDDVLIDDEEEAFEIDGEDAAFDLEDDGEIEPGEEEEPKA